jgi:hypothetical protein
VVGWKLGKSLEAELVVTALRNALVLRQPDEGLYFHSDRGRQYSSQAVRKPLTGDDHAPTVFAPGQNCVLNCTGCKKSGPLPPTALPSTGQITAIMPNASGKLLEQIPIGWGVRGPSVSHGQVYVGMGTGFAFPGFFTPASIVALGLPSSP